MTYICNIIIGIWKKVNMLILIHLLKSNAQLCNANDKLGIQRTDFQERGSEGVNGPCICNYIYKQLYDLLSLSGDIVMMLWIRPSIMLGLYEHNRH